MVLAVRLVLSLPSVGFYPRIVTQLAEHCTGIAQATGWNPIQVWISFSGYKFTTAVSCAGV